MNLTRRSALVASSAALLAPRAWAADADAPIAALIQGLLAAMRAGKASPFMQRYNALAPLVERAFDLPAILQVSVGPRWTALPADQQAALLDIFRKFTVASYVANFNEFGGEKIEVLPDARTVGADQVVATHIVPARGEAVRIDYVMRRGGSGWRAVDVLLNGSISQVAVYRSDWRSSLGAGAGPLIDNLKRKVADLSGGALS